MPLSTIAGENDIVAKLKTIKGITVHEGEYTPDSFVPEVDRRTGLFKPYALVKFSGAFQTYDNGICGPDKDTLRNTFSVYLVTPDDNLTRQFVDDVRVAMLTDFRPTDGGSLRPSGGYSFVDSDLGYNRYVHNIGFSYMTNLS